MANSSNSVGVYYRTNDYAGFWLRLLVDAIDATVVIAFCVVLTVVITYNHETDEFMARIVSLLWLTTFFLYFVLLKGSNLRTIGYKLGKLRVVNLKGERPSIYALTYRMAISFLGPLNFLFDLIWLSGDENKQALRDKFAKTYVIKIDAKPAGSGKLTYATYGFLGWRVTFCEIARSLPTNQAATKVEISR